MNDVSLYTTDMYYQFKDFRWLSSLIDDSILIPDNNPVYIPKIAMILEEQKKLIDAKSDGWVIL
jgi:hypothetical protein